MIKYYKYNCIKYYYMEVTSFISHFCSSFSPNDLALALKSSEELLKVSMEFISECGYLTDDKGLEQIEPLSIRELQNYCIESRYLDQNKFQHLNPATLISWLLEHDSVPLNQIANTELHLDSQIFPNIDYLDRVPQDQPVHCKFINQLIQLSAHFRKISNMRLDVFPQQANFEGPTNVNIERIFNSPILTEVYFPSTN